MAKSSNKSEFIQIRVTPAEKRVLKADAKRAGMELSAWMLSQAVLEPKLRWLTLCQVLKRNTDSPKRLAFAEMHDFLTALNRRRFSAVVSRDPLFEAHSMEGAVVAAMIDHEAVRKGASAPAWAARSAYVCSPPYFGSELMSVRLELLTRAPAPYRARNVFVSHGMGGRV